MMRDEGDIPWGPRPRGLAVGARPTPKGVELMVGPPDVPGAIVVPMTARECRQLRKALAQSLRDHQLGVFATIRPQRPDQ
jgi:hypothetical protein